MSAYLREMERAQSDAEDLASLLDRSGELTFTQLMQAFGLATMVRDALLRAATARYTDEGAGR